MSYTSLIHAPWRAEPDNDTSMPDAWCQASELLPRVDAWRVWLEGQPKGRWLLFEPDPAAFTAALLALWETGRSAGLASDDRDETMTHLTQQVDGRIQGAPPPAASTPPPPLAIDAQTEAVVLYTSGSTGEPAMHAKSFEQLANELNCHAELWPMEHHAVISQVSHQHIYGLLTGILRPLCHGIPFCGADSRYPEPMAARLGEARATNRQPLLVSSPPQLSRLPEHIDWQSSAPWQVLSSGAPLSRADARRCEQLFQAPVIEIYGSTETGGIAWRRQSQSAAWQPLPGVETRETDGLLELRSPFLPREYQPPGRWWPQQDRIETCTEGFRLLGRADRVAKVAGKRISLTAIEGHLTQLSQVEAAHCCDLDRRDGRIGVVVALPGDQAPWDHEVRRQLIRQMREQLSTLLEAVAIPRYWRFVEQIPTNRQGKLDRAEIQRLFADLDNERSARWLGESTNGEGQCCITLEVPERLCYLEGHFTDFPLVPGVVLVQWAVEHARRSFNEPVEFRGVERLKFQKVVRPGQRLVLSLTRKADSIGFSYDSPQGRHAAGRIRLAAERLNG
ncbi:AMP-binding protein [Halomonas cupida]|uniref:AMP-binding protein n=1 Tax=Halomonas cupida TaxID=44933 RepID=UPI003A942D8B